VSARADGTATVAWFLGGCCVAAVAVSWGSSRGQGRTWRFSTMVSLASSRWPGRLRFTGSQRGLSGEAVNPDQSREPSDTLALSLLLLCLLGCPASAWGGYFWFAPAPDAWFEERGFCRVPADQYQSGDMPPQLLSYFSYSAGGHADGLLLSVHGYGPGQTVFWRKGRIQKVGTYDRGFLGIDDHGRMLLTTGAAEGAVADTVEVSPGSILLRLTPEEGESWGESWRYSGVGSIAINHVYSPTQARLVDLLTLERFGDDQGWEWISIAPVRGKDQAGEPSAWVFSRGADYWRHFRSLLELRTGRLLANVVWAVDARLPINSGVAAMDPEHDLLMAIDATAKAFPWQPPRGLIYRRTETDLELVASAVVADAADDWVPRSLMPCDKLLQIVAELRARVRR